MDLQPTLTAREVATLLKINVKTLYRWIERGRIEPEAVIRLGRTIRIKREYVDRLYAQHTGWTGMERVA